MKTLLSRIKSTLLADATLGAYLSQESVKVTSPDLLPDISNALLPFIGVAPLSTSEGWVATGKQDVIHTVKLFVITNLEIIETAIMGDSTKKSILEVVNDVKDVLRAKVFTVDSVNYLSKPTTMSGITYNTAQYGDNVYLFVATMTLTCVRQIDVTVT